MEPAAISKNRIYLEVIKGMENVNVIGPGGQTPLMMSVLGGHYKLVKGRDLKTKLLCKKFSSRKTLIRNSSTS